MDKERQKITHDSIDELSKERIEEPTKNPQGEAIEAAEKPGQGKKKKRKKKWKRIFIAIIIFIFILLAAYLGIAYYFSDHYYYGSTINCFDVSGKTVDEAKAVINFDVQQYTLRLKERGGNIMEVKAAEVGLRYESEEAFHQFKHDQDPLKWIFAYFDENKPAMTLGRTYDERMLRERIDSLPCFDSSNIIEPKNPRIEYDGNRYVIIEEDRGKKVDKDILYALVAEAILKEETELDLDAAGCYAEPEYTSKSQKVVEAVNLLNTYAGASITYTFGSRKETLDGSTIHKWLTVDEEYKVTFDEKKAEEYIDELLKNYNTIGKTRTFRTSSGKTIKVKGGDYGWAVDKAKETERLIAAIKEGKTVVQEPEYKQRALSHGEDDIGNTYVEIDLKGQHIWFYKKGVLITHGDIVTGDLKRGYATPKGVYRLKYKAKDVILRGEDYEAPVTYWMPFNRGIGIHDTSWRKSFGGEIYKTNGSHGCINTPFPVAKAIFNNIKANTPVICY
ncbi:MAG: peptidoglycan binding domain-containing protein [Clostridia bacterium]